MFPLQVVFNLKTSISIQKRHCYSGNRETPGDSKNVFLHCGDVLGGFQDCASGRGLAGEWGDSEAQ